MSDKIKKIILFSIPMSICNFRCSYCYLAQRDEHYQGIQPQMKYSPEQIERALTIERVGGVAYTNFCADGETLLLKNIDEYVKAVVKNGHYAEVVTNMTITPVLEKFLSWDKELLKHVEFKCSFHYLELKKKNLLNVFAQNIQNVWKAGASANIEITPSDDLIPYIEEVKEYSMKNFGAFPHLSIARNDKTRKIEYLTNLSMEEYDKIWGQFDSEFWKFKKTIFGVRQNQFCYAGDWLLCVNLSTGIANQCYFGKQLGDIFADPNSPLPHQAIGSCQIAHCYNGHMLLTLGAIPGFTDVGYGDIRDRQRIDDETWLQPELKAFFNSKLEESNEIYKMHQKIGAILNSGLHYSITITDHLIKKAISKLKKN